MNKYFFYDKENDILSIHKGFSSDEKFKGNIDIGEIVLDVSTQGRIKGIEITNAISFFKDFEINEEILENLTGAEFKTKIGPNNIMVMIFIKSKIVKNEIPAKIAVPLGIPRRH